MPPKTKNKTTKKTKRRAPFGIHGVEIAAGKRSLVQIPVARVPTGQVLDLPVHVLHGVGPGPVMFVSAALHGDELGGIATIRQLLETLDARKLSGTALVVPVINGFGVINASRYLPDRRDLNRSFPGSARGSLTAQLAHLFLETIVARCDFGIDLHCGSAGRSNLPQVRCDLDDSRAAELAEAFCGPLRLHAKYRKGSLRAAARKLGTTVILHEAGEAHRLNRIPVRAALHGILRVLAAEQMWPEAPPVHDGPTYVSRKSRWVRATRSGVCEILPGLGQQVSKGDPVARIYDPSTMEEHKVKSLQDGLVIGVQRQTIVYRGDALLHLARVG